MAIESRTTGETESGAIRDHTVALTPYDEYRTSESGKCSRHRESESNRSSNRNPRVPGCMLAEPNGPEPKAQGRPPQEIVRTNGTQNRKHRPDMQTITAKQEGQVR